jgi:hypothetical protein
MSASRLVTKKERLLPGIYSNVKENVFSADFLYLGYKPPAIKYAIIITLAIVFLLMQARRRSV